MKRKVWLIFSAMLFSVGFICIFLCSAQIRNGILSGISVSVCVLIPSLFLPMILCTFLQNSGLYNVFGRILDKPSRLILNMQGDGLCIFILSMISGYPVGAVMCMSAYASGALDKNSAKTLSLYSICAGPAFIIIAVGENLLKSRESGIVLLICHILSAIITAISVSLFSRLRKKSTDEKATQISRKDDINIMSAIVKSVYSSAKSILLVCAYTCIFSAVIGVFCAYVNSDIIKTALVCVSEVTNACIYFANSGNLPIIAALLGFSGLSVIAQVCGALGPLCDIKKIIAVRLFNAGVSFSVCSLVLLIYPIKSAVSAVAVSGTKMQIEVTSSTVIMSVLLILSAIIFLYSVYQRKNKRLVDFF